MTCSKQHGYILLPVVILLTLVATAAFMLDYESALDSGVTASALEARQAELVAEAGLAHAAWAVQNSGCIGDIATATVPLGKNSYDITVDASGQTGTQYVMNPDQDTWIKEAAPAELHGSDSLLSVKNTAGDQFRALYRFDLTAIPAAARVVAATLRLYTETGDGGGAVQLHPVTAAWDEGTANWESMSDAYSPETFGVIAQQSGTGFWTGVNLTGLVQRWVNDPALNHGIMLIATSSDIESRYASTEAASGQHPVLEITTASAAVQKVKLKAKGTLTGTPSPARDITRSLVRTGERAYQPASTHVLQPDAGDGKDAWLTADKTTWNYGKAGFLRVRAGGGGHWRSPFQYDLERVPHGAQIRSATLELYRFAGTQDAAGLVNVHAITGDWVEGDNNGGTGPGVTWDLRDLGLYWSTAGGDFDAEPSASIQIDASVDTWFSADITALVQQWVDGSRDNHGMMLVAGDDVVRAEFKSSDEADPTLRPKLTIRYACECGSPCLATRGSGTVLMVVINPTTLVARDAYKKALFESWGYTVNVVGESANQASYDAALAVSDVVFISETVNANQVGAKLQDVSHAVVSQDGIYNDDLGIASGNAFAVASAINLTDTSHYIASVFPPGPLEIYDGAMEQLTVSGSMGPDLQTLADTAGAGSLVVLDKGAIGSNGTPLPGRRVMLPFGRDARFNWDYLNANGRLLLHRALQWGMGADLAGLPQQNMLFVSGGSLVIEQPSGDTLINPTAQEQLRIELIESWGYTVTLIHHTQSQADFDAALSGQIVAYVSSDVTEAGLGTKLVNAAIGVVNEQAALVDEFGFGMQSVNYKARAVIDVIQNTHYITEPFAAGPLTILSSDQMLHIMTANKGTGFIALAQVFNTGSLWDDALGVLESGAALYGGGSAAGRRALLPWGDASFDVAALNADGQTLMRRTIDWSAGLGDTLASASSLWLATLNDVTASGVPGLSSWADGEIVVFGEPNIALEPGTTDGTFASIVNLDSFASDGNVEIHGLHYVDSAITVGGANSVDLQPGDVLITTAGGETLTSNNAISVNNEDVFVFRPATAGDYSAGQFIFLLDGSQIHTETDTVAISLVEKDTTVGDAVLTAGTFLYATTNRRDVLMFKADDVGAGTTSGTVAELVDGSDVSLDSEIRGLDLVEDAVLIGEKTIPSGAILMTLNDDGMFSGDNGVPTESEDIFYLVMTQTGAASIGDATLLFEGSDVNLDTTNEDLQALTLVNSVTGGGGGGGGSDPPPTCDATLADDFETDDYTGSTGSLAWSTDWLEVNESDGPGGGDEQVVSHAGDLAGRLKDNGSGNSGEGLERGADLSGYTAATLTYTYWRVLGNNDSVIVEVSNDGGVNWSQLGLYVGPATDADADPQSASHDITPYISPDTRIRFMTGTSNGKNDGMYIDDVKVCLTN